MILPMASLQILGPRRLLGEAVELLQREGALELREAAGASPATSTADPAGASGLGAAIARIDVVARKLPEVEPAPEAPPLPPAATDAFAAALDEIEARSAAFAARRAALREEAAEAARLARLLGALAPLRAEAPLPARARALGLSLRRDRAEALGVLEREVARLTGGAYDLRSREAGDEIAVLLAVPEARAAAVSALLFEQGVGEVKLPERLAARGPARGAVAFASRAREVPHELEALDAEERGYAAGARRALADARAAAEARLARVEAFSRCGETAHAFVLAGYAPRKYVPRIERALARAFGDAVAVVEHPLREAGLDAVPVVLSNPRWLRPFERLLALAPLPRYGSTDPTPWLALFYPLLFGLVLADLGFAAVATIVAVVAIARRWGGEVGRDAAFVALACAAWAAVFGLAFGELFGEWGAQVGIHPIVLDRRRALLAFLGVALVAGALHLAVGLVLGVVGAAREREVRLVVARASRLALLVAAGVAAAAALGRLPPPALRWALGAIAACAVLGVLAEGPLALLDAVLTAGNVLSYARLMALGIASVMLAEAANGLAEALPGASGLVAAVLLHAVNFTLGLLSPAIAALRLQYVEFFEKFYREGGHPFRPLALAR